MSEKRKYSHFGTRSNLVGDIFLGTSSPNNKLFGTTVQANKYKSFELMNLDVNLQMQVCRYASIKYARIQMCEYVHERLLSTILQEFWEEISQIRWEISHSVQDTQSQGVTWRFMFKKWLRSSTAFFNKVREGWGYQVYWKPNRFCHLQTRIQWNPCS